MNILWNSHSISSCPKIVATRSIREAPAPTEDGMTAIWNSANETFTALNEAFLRLVSSASNEELVGKVQTQFKSLANEVETQVAKITEEVCQPTNPNWCEICFPTD